MRLSIKTEQRVDYKKLKAINAQSQMKIKIISKEIDLFLAD